MQSQTLKLAGFEADDIGVAMSGQAHLVTDAGGDAKHSFPDIEGKHSILWRLRHSFEHDLHTQGGDLSIADELAAINKEKPAFTELDLSDTLGSVGVAKETIKILEDRMGRDGLFIIVNAGERGEKEVESILVRNRGMLRTAMATEPTDSMPIERI